MRANQRKGEVSTLKIDKMSEGRGTKGFNISLRSSCVDQPEPFFRASQRPRLRWPVIDRGPLWPKRRPFF